MSKFYVTDRYWSDAVEVDAEGHEEAARGYPLDALEESASDVWSSMEVIVSTSPDGSDARKFSLGVRVVWEYTCDEVK